MSKIAACAAQAELKLNDRVSIGQPFDSRVGLPNSSNVVGSASVYSGGVLRFVENHMLVIRQEAGVLPPQRQIREEEMMVHDDELGALRSAPDPSHEARLVVLTAGADSSVGATHDPRPNRIVLGDRVEVGSIAGVGLVNPPAERRKAPREPRLRGVRTSLKLVEAAQAHVVRETLHTRGVDLDAEVAFESGQVLFHDLVLQGASSRRHQDPAAAQRRRET